jgi:hypothetical protein
MSAKNQPSTLIPDEAGKKVIKKNSKHLADMNLAPEVQSHLRVMSYLLLVDHLSSFFLFDAFVC